MKIIKFGAEWCAPCRAMEPILKDVVAELKALPVDLEIVHVNIDDQPELAQENGVRAVPTLVFMKDEKEVHRIVGATTKAVLLKTVSDLF